MPAQVILKPRRARPFFHHHPWVFQNAIDSIRPQASEPRAADANVHVDPRSVETSPSSSIAPASPAVASERTGELPEFAVFVAGDGVAVEEVEPIHEVDVPQPKVAEPTVPTAGNGLASESAAANSRATSGKPVVGDEVAVYSQERQFIARGLYNPVSNIQVRLYCWNQTTDIDRDFWKQRITQAVALRQRMFAHVDKARSAYRLIFSEGDGISGLIVDKFGEWLILQVTSRALWRFKDDLIGLLREQFQPRGIWLRTEKGIGEAEGLELADGLICGEEPPRPLFIEDGGLQFGVDIVQGQKTGFFLDQRDNRAAVARYCRGHRVLDAYSYSGGFGLAAVVLGDAHDVLAIDSSEPALSLARANAELNGVISKFQFEKSDASAAMRRFAEAGRQFDTVILDPPKLVRNRSGITRALKAYQKINEAALRIIAPGGFLVTCSCSGLLDRTTFIEMLTTAALRQSRSLQILESRGSAPDHPVMSTCPETDYLKCCICRVS